MPPSLLCILPQLPSCVQLNNLSGACNCSLFWGEYLCYNSLSFQDEHLWEIERNNWWGYGPLHKNLKTHSYTVHIQNDSFYWASSYSSKNKQKGEVGVLKQVLWFQSVPNYFDNGTHCEPRCKERSFQVRYWFRSHTHARTHTRSTVCSPTQLRAGTGPGTCWMFQACILPDQLGPAEGDTHAHTRTQIRITELLTAAFLSSYQSHQWAHSYSEERFDPAKLPIL